jgi:hypothetical protein
MNRALVLIATGALWAILMAELVKRELLPYLEYKAPPSYRAMLEGRRDPLLQRWKILLDGQVIGSSESLTEPREDRSTRIRSRTSYDAQPLLPPAMAKVLGGAARIESATETLLDTSFQVSRFSMELKAPGLSGGTTAVRRGGDLLITYDTPLFKGEKVMPYEEDMTLSDTSMPLQGAGKLHVNKTWSIHTVELDLKEKVKKSRMYAVVHSREPRAWKDGTVEVFRVDVSREPNGKPVYHVYVDDKGRVIEQRAMLGEGRELRYVLDEERAPTPEETRSWKP